MSDAEWQQAVRLFCLRGGISGTDLARALGIHHKTGQRMLRILRQLTKELQPVLLPGTTEWDETTARRKTWVVGGVSRIARRCFLQLVPQRGQEVLIPLVLAHTEAGEIRCTDEWMGYEGLPDRLSVCHAKEFVASYGTGIHTNTQEGVWGHMKPLGVHVYRGFPRETLSEFLSEVMFRYNYRDYSQRVQVITALLERKKKTNS